MPFPERLIASASGAAALLLFGAFALSTGLHQSVKPGRGIQSLQAATPGPCPPAASSQVAFAERASFDELEATVVRYLQAGGDPADLLRLVRSLHVPPGSAAAQAYYPGYYYLAEVSLAKGDLTGDGQPETVLLLRLESSDWGGGAVGIILGCMANHPEPLYSIRSDYQLEFVGFTDLTDDSVLEAFFMQAVNAVSTWPAVIAWSDDGFRRLPFAPSGVMRDDFVDLDELFLLFVDASLVRNLAEAGHDGLHIRRQARSTQQFSEGPQRDRQESWIWDGSSLSLIDWRYDPPTYRFQAVQDGDDESRLGRYSSARTAYQRVISDRRLEDWSLFDQPASAYQRLGLTAPAADPAERSRLSAYASYRIMLLDLLLGRTSQAENALRALREGFPVGVPGHAYVELAEAFWDGFRANQNMGEGCRAAAEHALRNANQVLIPLGKSSYGWRSRDYLPADICPFG